MDKAKQQLNAMPDPWYNRIEMATNSFPVLPLWSKVYFLAPEPRSALWIALTIDCSRRKTVSIPRQGFWLEFVSSPKNLQPLLLDPNFYILRNSGYTSKWLMTTWWKVLWSERSLWLFLSQLTIIWMQPWVNSATVMYIK